MQFNNAKLNYVRLYGKELILSETVLFQQLPLIIAVYQTLAHTHSISKVRCLIDN